LSLDIEPSDLVLNVLIGPDPPHVFIDFLQLLSSFSLQPLFLKISLSLLFLQFGFFLLSLDLEGRLDSFLLLCFLF
jgi:hypothetical protein